MRFKKWARAAKTPPPDANSPSALSDAQTEGGVRLHSSKLLAANDQPGLHWQRRAFSRALES
jgi:hypothetical protein